MDSYFSSTYVHRAQLQPGSGFEKRIREASLPSQK